MFINAIPHAEIEYNTTLQLGVHALSSNKMLDISTNNTDRLFLLIRFCPFWVYIYMCVSILANFPGFYI